MSLKFIVIQIWVTKDDFLEGLHRSPVRTGRDASVDKALVIQIFVRQVECGARPEFKFGSWSLISIEIPDSFRLTTWRIAVLLPVVGTPAY